jgi:hypothetical protein
MVGSMAAIMAIPSTIVEGYIELGTRFEARVLPRIGRQSRLQVVPCDGILENNPQWRRPVITKYKFLVSALCGEVRMAS